MPLQHGTVAPTGAPPAAAGIAHSAVRVGIPRGWTNLTGGLAAAPPQEYGWASAYDAITRSVILFGGCGYSLQAGCLNETWSYSGSSGWALLDNGSRTSPSARQGPAMDYDPLLGAIVLFGGDVQGTILGDTWEWKADRWTQLTNLSTSPPARFDSTMAYDPQVGALVLFGGSACGSYVACSDTWEFNGTWYQVPTQHSPAARAWFGMTFDAADGYLLLFGGQGANGSFYGLNDSWRFNGTDWSQILTRSAPPTEQQVVLAYDPVGESVVDFPLGTTSTWTFSHGHWTNLSSRLALAPPARGLPAMASDPSDGYVLLFGGSSGTPSHLQIGTCPPCLNDTWAWRGPKGPLYTVATASASVVDARMVVHFSDPAVYNGRWPWTFSWNFGDGTTATGRNVTHVYDLTGTFDPTVFVNDSRGRSANASTVVTVNSLPRIAATSSPSRTDVGLSAAFAVAVAGGTAPFRYLWEFGDGNASTSADPSHAYATAGWYEVRVNVTDNVGRLATATVSIKVNPALQLLNLSVKPVPAKIGQVVNFTVSFQGGTRDFSIAWRFGDGTRGGDVARIGHIYLSTGPFRVQVTITDGVGEAVRGVIWVTVT